MSETRQRTEYVSSAELTRNFAYWQDRAARTPLTITYHGRPRSVLVSAEAFREMPATSRTDEQASLRRLEFDFLLDHIDSGLILLSANLHVTEVSNRAAIIVGQSGQDLAGRMVADAIPALSSPAALADLRTVLRTGEEAQLDLPLSPQDGARLRVRAFHWVDGLALLIRSYYEDDEAARIAEQAAFEAARAAHGMIEVVRLSVRGTISMVEPAFARALGVPRERFPGQRFVDLITVRDRARAREAIENVLSGRSGVEAIDVHLLADGAIDLPVRVSIAPVASGFAVGGALAVVTFASPLR